jgi:hypothetical protein
MFKSKERRELEKAAEDLMRNAGTRSGGKRVNRIVSEEETEANRNVARQMMATAKRMR